MTKYVRGGGDLYARDRYGNPPLHVVSVCVLSLHDVYHHARATLSLRVSVKDRLGSDVKTKAGIMFLGGVVYRIYVRVVMIRNVGVGLCRVAHHTPSAAARERDQSVCT